MRVEHTFLSTKATTSGVGTNIDAVATNKEIFIVKFEHANGKCASELIVRQTELSIATKGSNHLTRNGSIELVVIEEKLILGVGPHRRESTREIVVGQIDANQLTAVRKELRRDGSNKSSGMTIANEHKESNNGFKVRNNCPKKHSFTWQEIDD